MAGRKDENLKIQKINSIDEIDENRFYMVPEISGLFAHTFRVSVAGVKNLMKVQGEDGYDEAELKAVKLGKKSYRILGSEVVNYFRRNYPMLLAGTRHEVTDTPDSAESNADSGENTTESPAEDSEPRKRGK